MKYPWMPLFWGDFLANTMHLSAQEAGAYLFLIAHAWEHNGEIPADRVRLARIAHVRQDRWNDVWKALEPFFRKSTVTMITGTHDHGYHHERVTAELQRLGKIANKRKAAAEQLHGKSSANAEQTTPLSTSTSTSNRDFLTNGKGREAEYRSPPRNKSDNVLTPLPDKQLLAAKRKGAK